MKKISRSTILGKRPVDSLREASLPSQPKSMLRLSCSSRSQLTALKQVHDDRGPLRDLSNVVGQNVPSRSRSGLLDQPGHMGNSHNFHAGQENIQPGVPLQGVPMCHPSNGQSGPPDIVDILDDGVAVIHVNTPDHGASASGSSMDSNLYWDIGDPKYTCSYCGSFFWYDERVEKNFKPKMPKYNGCCLNGKIVLPKVERPPALLQELLFQNDPTSKHFVANIRTYNSMFSFTSMGGKIDWSVNAGGSPPMFRLHGQNCHLIGSLLPPDGQVAKFAQLYIYDTENEITNRLGSISGGNASNTLIADLVKRLKEMLDSCNVLAKSFRMMKERFEETPGASEMRLRLIGRRGTDARRYNMPSISEVAALVVGDLDESYEARDIIVQFKTIELQRISEVHPCYLSLQYPLLFPFGEDGYRDDVLLAEPSGPRSREVRKKVSMREFYAYKLHQRLNEFAIIFVSKKLFQQFLVDVWCMIEANRLLYVRLNQKKIRCDFFKGLHDALLRGENDPSKHGKHIILSSTFTGGARYMIQNYQDAMAICRWVGFPNLFITFTCNPTWPEISRFVDHQNLQAVDRPDIIAHVFKIKLDHMIKDFKENKTFGTVKAVIYTVEFQKRGLPHAHILLFLSDAGKFATPESIDEIISAEIPDPTCDPEYHKLVGEFMMHGPCGPSKPNSPCMSDGRCTKDFPKRFVQLTTIDDDGYPVYKRRDNGRFIEKNGVILDNRYVVPHNRYLLTTYGAHINIEYCNRTQSVKYLFKYINKGHDRVTVAFSESASNVASEDAVDEVKMYYDCRYISACEAAWRIFTFDIHYRTPSVERLGFHLPDQQAIIFTEDDPLDAVVDRATIRQSKFLAWFEANNKYPEARELTYPEFPTKFVWKDRLREWTVRKRGFTIGRLAYIPPGSGEVYYLRCLLNIRRGPRSYEELRHVGGVQYATFQEACYALGLLDDDKEYIDGIKEASHWATAHALRYLFVTLLTSNSISMPGRVWDSCWEPLCDDVLYNQRIRSRNPDLVLAEDDIKNFGLHAIEVLLHRLGQSLHDFTSMPYPTGDIPELNQNTFIADELCYDRQSLAAEYEEFLEKCTVEQRHVHDTILNAANNDSGGLFFVYGYGGTGKTFVWKGLSAALRSKSEIVINVASSGIASLLLPGGRTAHSRFKIPINPTEDSTCNITANSDLAMLLIRAKLIIWDEAPMMTRFCFEALDKTMRDIMHSVCPSNACKIFGGITVVLGGDFRQILPVIPKGSQQEIVNATISSSYLWKQCTVLRLTRNMRLGSARSDAERTELEEFAKWLANVGDGELGSPNDGEVDIQVPEDMLIKYSGNSIAAIVDEIYPSFHDSMDNPEYMQERAILVPTVNAVESINDYMLSLNKNCEGRQYFSSDKACDSDSNSTLMNEIHTPEFLNSINCSGLPGHELHLMVGTPVMLLRNIDHANGLCNGTRLIITRLGSHVLEAKVIAGGHMGNKVLIPRMIMSPSDVTLPFKFERKQFPIMVCYAMTINKSQGQSLKHVGLFLKRPVFSHGQLYVALSWVTNRSGLKVLLSDRESEQTTNCTTNVVYKEVLQNV